MSQLTVSPLAQHLAEVNNVDITALQAASAESVITARNVLDFLNFTAEEEAVVKRRSARHTTAEPSLKAISENAEEPPSLDSTPITLTQNDSQPPIKDESSPHPKANDKQVLDQTRAQLQATALVHQKALMQVGALRQRSERLDFEVLHLKGKEASATAYIQELQERQRELEQELEKSQKRSARFAWLKRIF